MNTHQQPASAALADTNAIAEAIAALPPAYDLLPAATRFTAINTNENWASGAGKRALDLLISVPVLLMLSPVLAIIALLIRFDSKGPALFRQIRTGMCGRTFEILKFRSMFVLENGATIKQARENDPRTTRVGRFLRHYSLDELPQLINVVRGDMSLVGPRPHARAHDEYYSDIIADYRHRHAVKPGMTGWAQINGYRGPTPTVETMARRIDLDVWYVRNAGLAVDIKILLRTPLEILRPRNAH